MKTSVNKTESPPWQKDSTVIACLIIINGITAIMESGIILAPTPFFFFLRTAKAGQSKTAVTAEQNKYKRLKGNANDNVNATADKKGLNPKYSVDKNSGTLINEFLVAQFKSRDKVVSAVSLTTVL
jgi:hypothetical protein